MPFSLYSLCILSLLGLLCDLFTRTGTVFLYIPIKMLMMHCFKLVVVENFIHFLVIFCLMPGNTATYSDCFLY